MSSILGLLIVGIIVIVATAIVIKVATVLMPVILALGGIGIFFYVIENADHFRSEPIKKEIQQQVVKFRDDIQREYHEQMLSMTRRKSGVQLNSLCPEMDSVIAVVASAYQAFMNDDKFKPLITSANDFEGHVLKSAHYVGAALDFRIKDIGEQSNRKKLVQRIRNELGERFTVLHEDIGSANEHLHIQLNRDSYNRNVVWK